MPKSQNEKVEKTLTYENVNNLIQGRRKVLNGFESKIFPVKNPTRSTCLKI